MKDIKEYIKEKANEYEQRSLNWEEKIKAITAYMKNAETDEDISRMKFERQQCIAKKNELLAVADFCNELLLKYFD